MIFTSCWSPPPLRLLLSGSNQLLLLPLWRWGWKSFHQTRGNKSEPLHQDCKQRKFFCRVMKSLLGLLWCLSRNASPRRMRNYLRVLLLFFFFFFSTFVIFPVQREKRLILKQQFRQSEHPPAHKQTSKSDIVYFLSVVVFFLENEIVAFYLLLRLFEDEGPLLWLLFSCYT